MNINLNAEELTLIERSWTALEPTAAAAMESFYARLFALNPELAPLFQDDPGQQQRKLSTTLSALVAGLRQPSQLWPALQLLGRKHFEYGAKPAHYAQVGEALLWMLEKQLGDSYTPEVQSAWTKLYSAVADAMILAGTQESVA